MSSKKRLTSTKEEAGPALVPKLRFPEFQPTREWVMRTLGSFASFSSGGTPSKDNTKYWNGDIPWVSASSMYDLVVKKADHYVTSLAIGNGTRIAKKGSILILVRGSMLFKRVPICVAGVDVAFNQDVKALDVDASIDTTFLLYQLSAFQARFPINETGIGAGKIELDHLKCFELLIPDLPEQKKIAECLSSLDELIAAQARKVDALKTHKKGLMQQLFPREGETQPRLRFPEFRGNGDWTTETLGSVAKISTEKVGSNTCTPMSITSGVGLVSQMEKFGRIIAGSSYANYLLLKKNDFAYNKSATKEYPEGFIALYSGDELAAVPNSIFTCFRIKDESPVPQYLNYLFLGNLHGKWLRRFIEVGARAHGSLSINDLDLLSLPVPVPVGNNSVAEQKKIAECLSSLDELIATQARKVDALKTHKIGLMQQLFPSPEEV